MFQNCNHFGVNKDYSNLSIGSFFSFQRIPEIPGGGVYARFHASSHSTAAPTVDCLAELLRGASQGHGGTATDI